MENKNPVLDPHLQDTDDDASLERGDPFGDDETEEADPEHPEAGIDHTPPGE